MVKFALSDLLCTLIFLDYELKSVRDVKNEMYLSLGEALGKNIVKPDGTFVDTSDNQTMSLNDDHHTYLNSILGC